MQASVKIDISTQHYFPFYMHILGGMFILFSLLIILMNTILSILLFIVGILFLTTHYRLFIDPHANTYKEYLWIMGMKRGEIKSFPKAEYIFINLLERESEFGLVARLSARMTVFQGYIRLSNGEVIYFGEKRSEEAMYDKAKKLARNLGVIVKKNYD